MLNINAQKNRNKKAQGNRKQVKNTSSAKKILSQKSGNYTPCHTSLWICGEYLDNIVMGISLRIQM